MTVARCDQIADDPADIALLRGVIIGAGMVSCDRHRPSLMPIVELLQEARSIGDVLRRLEHLANRPELRPMKIDVDLHASDIDQLRATCPRFLHQTIGFRPAFRKKSLAFDVDRVGAERAFASRFRQPYRI